MNLQNLSKAVCKNKVFTYLLDKYDGEDDTNGVNRNNNANLNRNNNMNYSININNNINNINRSNRNNNNYHHGLYQGWRSGIVHASRWNT